MANEKPLKVDDHVLNPDGYAYQVKAIDGDKLVLQGVATYTGAQLTGKLVADRRTAKLQKVSAAFVIALKG